MLLEQYLAMVNVWGIKSLCGDIKRLPAPDVHVPYSIVREAHQRTTAKMSLVLVILMLVGIPHFEMVLQGGISLVKDALLGNQLVLAPLQPFGGHN